MKKTNRAPGHLSREAKQDWQKFKKEYGIDDSGGLAILKAGLEAKDLAEACRRKIEKEGLTITDRFGIEKPHPLLAAERDARAQWLAALKALNLDIEPLKAGPGRPLEGYLG